MQGRSRFISDIAQVASGAASALGGLREEIDNIVRQRIERILNSRGLVTREEFDALRTRHEALAARLAVIEAATGLGAAKGGGEAQAGKRKQAAAAKKTGTANSKNASADAPAGMRAGKAPKPAMGASGTGAARKATPKKPKA